MPRVPDTERPPGGDDERSETSATGVAPRPKVLFLGQHELDYPRNRATRRLIELAGCEPVDAHSRAPGLLREAVLAAACLRRMREVDAVFVTEGGHRFVPLVASIARRFGKKVVFDPFTSRYDTYVEDRKRYAPGGLHARRLHHMDEAAIRAADVCIFDTAEHREYFDTRHGLAGPAHVVEVGVDEAVFTLQPPRPAGETFEVLFYGTYIPLQGVEHIVDAATTLAGDGRTRFTLIGRGQTYPDVAAKVERLAPPNLRLRPPISPADLVEQMAASDVCLGIFGTSRKAAGVVPNKVVQAAAVGRPIVTRESPAVARYLDDASAVLVPPADPDALASALVALRDDPARCAELARGARAAFEREFSERVLAARMRAALEDALR